VTLAAAVCSQCLRQRRNPRFSTGVMFVRSRVSG
jgi:hypothetical protein